MLVLRWSDEAVDDLTEIIGYIEERDPRAAELLHADIMATCER